MTTPKGRLFQLALDCKKHAPGKAQKKKTVKVSGKHYDEGRAISLSYNVDVYDEPIYDSYRHDEPSAQLSFVDDMQEESFYVEPFESETIPANYEEVNDDDPMLDKVVGVSDEEEESQVIPESREHEAASQQEDEPVDMIPAADKKQEEPVQKPAEKPVNEDSMIPKQEAEEASQQYEVGDDEFANDIKAILQGEKVFDPDKKKTVNKGDSPSAELLKQGGANPPPSRRSSKHDEEELDPSANEHKIFEKIAQSMRYANSYDLGSIAMEKKFDQMESELEEKEIKTITAKKGIEDAEVIDEQSRQQSQTTASQKEKPEKYASGQPLNPENGGLEIGKQQLKAGDLLLATSTSSGSNEKECQAGVYVGDGKVVFARGSKKPEKIGIEQVLDEERGVVLRHKEAGAEIIQSLISKLDTDADVSDALDSILEINYAPVQVHQSVCESIPKEDQERCKQFKGRIDINTRDNDKFFIPYRIVKALETSGLSILDNDVEGTPSDTPIKTKHNGQWQYAGHLKLQN